MKKVTALILSIIICLLSVPCTISAAEKTESSEWFSVSIQLLKEDLENGGYVEDGEEQYVDVIIKEDCLLIDFVWIWKALGLTIDGASDSEHITLRKFPESQLAYNFTIGSDEMHAVSPYLGEIKVKLGSSVIRDQGKVFVPLAMFASIFNAEFYTAGSSIILYPPKETVVDVMHTNLHQYYFDIVEDSGLSYGDIAVSAGYGKLYRKIKSLLQGTVNLDIDKIKESLPQDTGYFSDILAKALCTDSADELEASSQQLSLLSSGCGIVASACAEAAEKVSDGLEAIAGQALENWVNADAKTKQIGNLSFDEYMDLCKDSAQKLQKAQSSKKISSLISKGCEAADISMNLFSIYFSGFVEYVVLSNEISSSQQEDVDAVKLFISQYNKSSGMSTSSSIISNIKDKAALYDGKSTDIFQNDELLSEICKSVGHGVAGFIVGEYSEGAAKMLSYCFPGLKNYSNILFQLQLVSFGWDAAEMLVNQVTGNSLESLDVLNAALYANLLEADTADIAEDARNSGDIEVYRQLEWMRLKSCYITRQFVMKYYEPQKILHPEEYNTVYEQEKKIYDEITRLMAILKNGLVGSTQESLDLAYENCKAANQELLENSIFRSCKGKVTDEDGNPVKAAIIVESEQGGDDNFAQADDNGEFTIKLQVGKYTLTADAGTNEYESFSMEIEVPDWNAVGYIIPQIILNYFKSCIKEGWYTYERSEGRPTDGLEVESFDGEEIRFNIEHIGSNYSPIYKTNSIIAKVEKDQVQNFSWRDNWGNSGYGSLNFNGNTVIVKMRIDAKASINRWIWYESIELAYREEKDENGNISLKTEKTKITGVEINNAYYEAAELFSQIFYGFSDSNGISVDKNTIIRNDKLLWRITDPSLQSIEDLKRKMQPYFSDELIERIIDVSQGDDSYSDDEYSLLFYGVNTGYYEYDNNLYVSIPSVGSTLAYEEISIEQVDNANYEVTVSAYHNFGFGTFTNKIMYSYIDGRWVFSTFCCNL